MLSKGRMSRLCRGLIFGFDGRVAGYSCGVCHIDSQMLDRTVIRRFEVFQMCL
jgi:hypothetical protein